MLFRSSLGKMDFEKIIVFVSSGRMVLSSAAVDIPIVIEDNLICEELIIDILVMEPVQWRECCVYKVPKKLHQVNKEAYTPKLISIGPFHRGEKDLRGEKGLRDDTTKKWAIPVFSKPLG